MKNIIRTCLITGAASAALMLGACDDSGEVKDVTPRKVDTSKPKINPGAGPGGGFSSMEDEDNSGQ